MAQHLCSCSTLSHILDFRTSVGEDGTGQSLKSCPAGRWETRESRGGSALAGPHSFVQMGGRGEGSRQGQWELEGPPENSVHTSHFIGEETAWEGGSDALLPPCVSSRESHLFSLYSRPNNIVSFSVLRLGPSMPFRIEVRVFRYETRRKRNSGKGVSALCP